LDCSPPLQTETHKISFLLIHCLVDFRVKYCDFLELHLSDCTSRFNSIVHVILSHDMPSPARRITHIQRLLVHVSKFENRSKITISLQRKCTYMLREYIILDAKRNYDSFSQTKSIISKLPSSNCYKFYHTMYNAVYKYVIICQRKTSDKTNSQKLVPLLFCITHCMKKQDCLDDKKIQSLIVKTTGFISCSLYIWGNDSFIHEQHSIL